ncbi:MAG TPA: hypothetical protein VGM74_21290 [Burkholderiaceae bacterium]|jgi:hypothetical protein
MRRWQLLWFAVLVVLVAPAAAHIAQVPYNLPVPFSMYAYGATGALVASFVVVGYFARSAPAGLGEAGRVVTEHPLVRFIGSGVARAVLQGLAVAALALSIASGFGAASQVSAAFNITFFWIICLLGYTYLTALIGDWYPLLNPWQALADWCFGAARSRPVRRAYPSWLGYYPALAWYLLLIWFELSGKSTPLALSCALIGYTVLTLAGVRVFGATAWMRHGEVFGVFFRMVAKMAPLDVDARQPAIAVRLRAPFVGCLQERPDHFSLVIFVLFMLSSTAFDGVHETLAWVSIFWRYLYPVLAAVIATHSKHQYLVLVNFFYYWQWLMLFVSPLFYLGIYWGFIAMTRRVTRSERTVRELAVAFTFSLIPIAFVYNVSHYFTEFVGQAPAILAIISDPFGLGWNLFGTRDLGWQDYMFEAGTVWHTQVWLILAGHIVSVYLAHLEALRIFRTRREATISQLPMLLLMMALTTIGLWILSLPIAAGQVLLPPGVGTPQ